MSLQSVTFWLKNSVNHILVEVMDELTGAQLIAESLKTQVGALKNTAKICETAKGQSSTLTLKSTG